MAITYGFYNSLGGDRKYNAAHISAIFNGIINDGVFMSVGDALMTTASEEEGMSVTVLTGRAWFDGTWTENDTALILNLEPSSLLLNRIDTVVLEVNAIEDVRANDIKVITGDPSTEPVPPTLIESELHNQYPLCHIYVGKGVTKIQQKDITITVGTSACPFVTGILETINTDPLLAQWTDEFNSKMVEWATRFSNDLTSWQNEFDADISEWTDDFTTWFNAIKGLLEEEQAGSLAAGILAVEDALASHEDNEMLHGTIQDPTTYSKYRLKIDDGAVYFEEVG